VKNNTEFLVFFKEFKLNSFL